MLMVVDRSAKMKTYTDQIVWKRNWAVKYGEGTNICRWKECDKDRDWAKWDKLNIDKHTLTTQFHFQFMIAAIGNGRRSKANSSYPNKINRKLFIEPEMDGKCQPNRVSMI